MKARFTTLRIIHIALAIGPVAFLGVAAMVGGQAGADPILSYVGYGGAGVGALLSFVLPGLLLERTKQPEGGAPEDRFGSYFIAKIVQWAACEGMAMLNGVVFFLSGNVPSAGVAGAMIVLVLYHAPTKGDFIKRLNIPLHREREIDI